MYTLLETGQACVRGACASKHAAMRGRHFVSPSCCHSESCNHPHLLRLSHSFPGSHAQSMRTKSLSEAGGLCVAQDIPAKTGLRDNERRLAGVHEHMIIGKRGQTCCGQAASQHMQICDFIGFKVLKSHLPDTRHSNTHHAQHTLPLACSHAKVFLISLNDTNCCRRRPFPQTSCCQLILLAVMPRHCFPQRVESD